MLVLICPLREGLQLYAELAQDRLRDHPRDDIPAGRKLAPQRCQEGDPVPPRVAQGVPGPQDLAFVEAPIRFDRKWFNPHRLHVLDVRLARLPARSGTYLCGSLFATAGQCSIHQEAQRIPDPAK